MATEFFGIVYFPTKSAFFEGAIPESMEAKYGIKGPYFLIKILCKIYKEGYYIPWDEEQCEIFAYKLGREYSKEEVTSMVSLLLEKGFFDKESYQKQQILTSLDIQRVWLEATSRRKRDLTKLPYLLEEIKCRQNTSSKSECADIPPAQMELNLENADISRQSRVEESKVEENRRSCLISSAGIRTQYKNTQLRWPAIGTGANQDNRYRRKKSDFTNVQLWRNRYSRMENTGTNSVE